LYQHAIEALVQSFWQKTIKNTVLVKRPNTQMTGMVCRSKNNVFELNSSVNEGFEI
jgi:hypothetical protein